MKFETIAVQGAHIAAENRHSISVPIYQTTAFDFDSVDYAADLFDLKCAGDIYTRISNPTTSVLEQRIALLEGGVGAVAVSSGQSASLLSILNIAGSGNEIVASSTLYGGTINLLASTLKKFGIITKFVASDDIEDYKKEINDKTVCIFSESIGNPNIKLADIESLANLAHENKIPLIVDNTVPTPYLLRPFEFGADIVVHSLTKYLTGHGNSMGGIIVDSGNFDWKQSEKFHELVDNDPSYHGLSYTDAFGKSAYIVKARAQLLRDLGTCLSPFNSYLTLLGLETLHLRMQRHSENALKIAQFLETNDCVEWVNYPGLKSYKYNNLANKYLSNGASSMLSFGIKGGKKAGTKFIENLKIFIHATNIGDSRSIVTYPAITTHRQLSEEQMKACSIDSSFIRLSAGLENVDDLIDDLSNALAISKQ